MTNARSLGNTRLSMLAAPRALSSRAEFVADIRREWTNALEATVQVGRRLNEAKAALPHGEYEAMIESELPFSPATARKLREVAAFVDSGKVPLDQLPEAYSTLYAIATLPDEARRRAVDQGVIRPDVTRAEVEAFKAPKPEPAAGPRPADLFSGAEPPPQRPTSAAIWPNADGPALPPPLIDAESPPPPPSVEPPKPVGVQAAINHPWSNAASDPGAILVDWGTGAALTLLVVVPHDPAAADIVRHVIALHNASLGA